MFDNIGGKIKIVAQILFLVGMVASVVLAIVLVTTLKLEALGLLLFIGVVVGGGLTSLIASWFLYGFGELIESQCNTSYATDRAADYLHQIDINLSKITKNLTTVNTPTSNASPMKSTASAAKPAPKAQESTISEEEKTYAYATQMYSQHSYNIAYNLFSKIPNYKDSSEYLEKLKSLI